MVKKKTNTEIPRRLQRQIDIMNAKSVKIALGESTKKEVVKKKKWVKVVLFYLAAIIMAVCIFTVFFVFQWVFSIKKIEVNSESKKIAIRGLEQYYTKNLIFLNKGKFEKDLTRRNSQLKSLSSQKKYPSTIILTAEVYQPLVALEVGQGGYFLLAPNGRILEKTKTKPIFPRIIYSQKLNYMLFAPGDFIEYSDLQIALYFLQKTTELGMRVDTIDIAGRSMIRLNVKNKQILFSTEKDKNLQTYQLNTIVRQFTITGHTFKTLDLRFEKPIISN